MSRYEKLSTILSVFALLAAIASPFISYHWLDPQFQAFKNRAKLQVTGAIIGDVNYEASTMRVTYGLTSPYELEIINVGQLPCKEIKIVSQQQQELRDKVHLPPDDASQDFSFEPLIPFDVTTKGNQHFITVNRPLAPNDKLKMTFKYVPSFVVVSNEWGEMTSLDMTSSRVSVYLKPPPGVE